MTLSSHKLFNIASASDSSSLLTREQGQELRNRVLEELSGTECLEVSVSDARALSPSFADELFGGLYSELGPEFSRRILVRCCRKDWRHLIASVIKRRKNRTKGSR